MKRTVLVCAALGLLAIFAACFFLPTFEMVKQKWIISQAVGKAKTIRIEMYQTLLDLSGSKEQVLSAKELAPEDFHKVADAFPISVSVSIPGNINKCLFDPHHRIIITDGAGNVTLVRVCFICDAVGIGDDEHLDLLDSPSNAWKKSLRQFFANEGMPEQ